MNMMIDLANANSKIERLEKALEEIANMEQPFAGVYEVVWRTMKDKMKRIAKRALSPDVQEKTK